MERQSDVAVDRLHDRLHLRSHGEDHRIHRNFLKHFVSSGAVHTARERRYILRRQHLQKIAVHLTLSRHHLHILFFGLLVAEENPRLGHDLTLLEIDRHRHRHLVQELETRQSGRADLLSGYRHNRTVIHHELHIAGTLDGLCQLRIAHQTLCFLLGEELLGGSFRLIIVNGSGIDQKGRFVISDDRHIRALRIGKEGDSILFERGETALLRKPAQETIELLAITHLEQTADRRIACLRRILHRHEHKHVAAHIQPRFRRMRQQREDASALLFGRIGQSLLGHLIINALGKIADLRFPGQGFGIDRNDHERVGRQHLAVILTATRCEHQRHERYAEEVEFFHIGIFIIVLSIH